MIIDKGGVNSIDIAGLISRLGLREAMTVADFGCGSQAHCAFWAAKTVGHKGKVYAVDIIKPALEAVAKSASRENLRNIHTLWSDLEAYNGTQISGGEIDAGFLVNVLHQSDNQLSVLREIARMLKKGSQLCLVEWRLGATPFGPLAEKRINPDNLKKISPRLGLHPREEFAVGLCHYGLIFEKA